MSALLTGTSGAQIQAVSAADSGTACSVAGSCAIWPIGGAKEVAIQVNGTFSGTVTFEASNDGNTWTAVGVTKSSDASTVTTTTGAGLFTLQTRGLAWLRGRATSYSSGALNISVSKA